MSKQHMGVLGVHYMKRKGKKLLYIDVFTPLSYKKEQLDYRSEPITKAISQSNWIKQINFSGQLIHNEYQFIAFSHLIGKSELEKWQTEFLGNKI